MNMTWAFLKKLRRRLFPTRIEVAEDAIQANVEALADLERKLEKLRQTVALCDDTDESKEFVSVAKKIIAFGEEQIAESAESIENCKQALRQVRAYSQAAKAP